MEDRRALETEFFAEILKGELKLAPYSGIIWYLEESMQFLVHFADELRRRESHALNLAETTHVNRIPEKKGICTFPIPSSPSGFLEICFRTVRQIVVCDKTDVRLIDSHPEGIGADHY